MTGQFFVEGDALAEKPYVYRISGLDDVVLMNGFRREATDYGEGVSIDNVDHLHFAIAMQIITTKKVLSPKELKFLRLEMELTQNDIAEAVGVDGQTIARYEKGESRIPGPVDRLVRFFFVFDCLPDDQKIEITKAIRAIVDEDEAHPRPLCFREQDGQWVEACA